MVVSKMEITTEHGAIPNKTQTKDVTFYNIDVILEATGDTVLTDAGKITAEFAKSFAESEFEKYRIIQDCLFQSDFDRFNDNLLSSDTE